MEDPCLQWSKSLSHTPSSWEISISTDTASSEWEEQRKYKIPGGCFSPKVLQGKHWLIKVLLKCKLAFMGMEMRFRGQILGLESWARPGRMELWATEDYFLDLHLNELPGMCLRIVQECWLLLILPIHSAPLSLPSPSPACFPVPFPHLFLNPQMKKNRAWRGEVGTGFRCVRASLGSRAVSFLLSLMASAEILIITFLCSL